MASIDPLTPIAPAPPGVTPDFHSITDLQVRLSVTFGVTYGIATILMCLRLYTGVFVVKKLYFDAFFLVAAWVLAGVFFFFLAKAFPVGFGRHIWDVNYGQLAVYSDYLTPLAIIYMWPLTCVKLSVLIVYYQIDPQMVFRYCGLCVAIFNIVPTLVYTGLFIDTCNPLKGNITCINTIIFTHTGTNIFADLLIMAMPIHMTWKLNMSIGKRLTVGALLALSSMCVIFPIVRTTYVRSYTNDPDVTWNQGVLVIFAILEINIGLVCNSLMMLKPFFRHHMPRFANRLFDRSSHSGAGGSHGHGNSGGNSQDRHDKTAAGQLGSSGGPGSPRSYRHKWDGGSSSRGRSDSYILHSIDKAETPDDEYNKTGSIESQRGVGGKMYMNSTVVMDKPMGAAHREDNSSERRIMQDWA